MQKTKTWPGRAALAAILAIASLGLAMVIGSATVTEAQAPASVTIKQLTLTTAEEVPPTTANAVGYFNATLRENALDFDLSAVAPNITAAHIHTAAKGVNGPVVAFLFGPADPPVNAIHPTGTITQANLVGPMAGNWKAFTDAMAKGDLYVNAHTTENPAGVIRAQIPATSLPVAAAPRPPATGNSAASGSDLVGSGIIGGVLVASAAGMLALYAVRRRA
jgi:hypothetical protein